MGSLDASGEEELERMPAAYQEVWPLADGWVERVTPWQLFPPLGHAELFGSGYRAQAAAVARRGSAH